MSSGQSLNRLVRVFPDAAREGTWDSGSVRSTVVIVDDDPGFRTRTRMILEAGEFVVLGESRDGASATAAVDRLRPEVVLLDVGLPDCDGFELARELCARPQAPDVIMISARDRDDYGPRVEQCGALGFIAKADLTADAVWVLLGGRVGG